MVCKVSSLFLRPAIFHDEFLCVDERRQMKTEEINSILLISSNFIISIPLWVRFLMLKFHYFSSSSLPIFYLQRFGAAHAEVVMKR